MEKKKTVKTPAKRPPVIEKKVNKPEPPVKLTAVKIIYNADFTEFEETCNNLLTVGWFPLFAPSVINSNGKFVYYQQYAKV